MAKSWWTDQRELPTLRRRAALGRHHSDPHHPLLPTLLLEAPKPTCRRCPRLRLLLCKRWVWVPYSPEKAPPVKTSISNKTQMLVLQGDCGTIKFEVFVVVLGHQADGGSASEKRQVDASGLRPSYCFAQACSRRLRHSNQRWRGHTRSRGRSHDTGMLQLYMYIITAMHLLTVYSTL